jgi:crotonobetainyl-CoA:carnitine CoA-transferase CaiB-like acyl-CoA transferase
MGTPPFPGGPPASPVMLIKQSDVLVENFRPGAMERLGLAYQQVKLVNPRLVYCSISGFGQNGPYRMLPGFDQVLQGMGGLMSITGEAGGPPVKVGVPIADITAGMFAAYGIAIALFTREKTGSGQMVDISLLDGQVALLTYRAGSFFASGEIPERIGSGHPVIVPYQAFKAKDVFINIAVGNDQLWGKFCKAVGLETIMNDPRFATNAKRVQNRDAVVKAVGDLIATKNGEEWLKILADAGIPCGPIYTVDKIFSDPQIIHRKMVTELHHPKAGTIKVTGNPVKLSDTPGEITVPPPLLGQHTREVLEGLGYSAKDIEELRQAKLI